MPSEDMDVEIRNFNLRGPFRLPAPDRIQIDIAARELKTSVPQILALASGDRPIITPIGQTKFGLEWLPVNSRVLETYFEFGCPDDFEFIVSEPHELTTGTNIGSAKNLFLRGEDFQLLLDQNAKRISNRKPGSGHHFQKTRNRIINATIRAIERSPSAAAELKHKDGTWNLSRLSDMVDDQRLSLDLPDLDEAPGFSRETIKTSIKEGIEGGLI